MSRFKTVTPRTNLLLDLILFALLITVMISGLAQNSFAPGTSGYLGWYHVHGVSGIMLGMLITLHLVLHLAWIECQIKRLFKRPVGHSKRTGEFL